MDDITKTQQSFARKALTNPQHQFTDVYHLLYREDWLRAALTRVLANQGSRTAGVDHLTRKQFADETYTQKFIAELREALRSGRFQPQPARRVYIPKPNGAQRPLGIPTIGNRVVQMLLKMLMEPIWESDFLDCSSGFRPQRRTMDCIAMCYRLINSSQKYFYAVEGDIKGCFDHVQQAILLRLIQRRIQDRRVLHLVELFLSAGYMEAEIFQATAEGVPQGGICSPLWTNIYLHEMDRYWWERYGNLDSETRKQRRRQGIGNHRLLRYADDWVILTNGLHSEAQRLREEFQHFLWEELRLELAEEKTLITHMETGFDFLGFHIRRYMHPNKGHKPVLLVKPSDKAIMRLKDKLRRMLSHRQGMDHPYLKMQAVNRVLRGWIGYYQHCNAKDVASDLDYWVNERVIRWFITHHKSGIREVLACYKRRQGTRFNLAVPNDKGELLFLYRMSDKPITRYVDRKRTNPYLTRWETQSVELAEEPDPDHAWDGNEQKFGWTAAQYARREYDQHQCVICGSSENLDVHHLNPRRWTQRKQGDDRLESLRTLCQDCHIKVEQGQIELTVMERRTR